MQSDNEKFVVSNSYLRIYDAQCFSSISQNLPQSSYINIGKFASVEYAGINVVVYIHCYINGNIVLVTAKTTQYSDTDAVHCRGFSYKTLLCC